MESFEERYPWYEEYKSLIFQSNLEHAIQLIKDNVAGDKLIYKYFRGINRDLETLKESQIWVCNAHYLNDPYDCAYFINRRSKLYYPEEERELATQELLEQIAQDRCSLERQNRVFVASFSECNNSLLMWSHYASQHKGCCAAFSLSEIINNYQLICLPVIYSVNKPSIEEQGDLVERLSKSTDWEYELEWRVFFEEDTIEFGQLIDFPRAKEIYMGLRHLETAQDNKMIRSKNKHDKSELFPGTTDYMRICKDEPKISLFRMEPYKDRYQLHSIEYTRLY